jgi:hypothetical protein
VSNSQANMVACDAISSVSARPLIDAVVALGNAAVALALRASTFKRPMPDLTRFSDNLLADMGFERDWDGSIVRITVDPKSWN